jgi:hypothetical protein
MFALHHTQRYAHCFINHSKGLGDTLFGEIGGVPRAFLVKRNRSVNLSLIFDELKREIEICVRFDQTPCLVHFFWLNTETFWRDKKNDEKRKDHSG